MSVSLSEPWEMVRTERGKPDVLQSRGRRVERVLATEQQQPARDLVCLSYLLFPEKFQRSRVSRIPGMLLAFPVS